MLKDNALFLDSSYNPFGVTISSLVFLHWEEYLFCRTKAQGILVQVEMLLSQCQSLISASSCVLFLPLRNFASVNPNVAYELC